MNDKSVKIEESPKIPKEVAGSPSTLTGTENAFDPLAIDEIGAVKKEPVVLINYNRFGKYVEINV